MKKKPIKIEILDYNLKKIGSRLDLYLTKNNQMVINSV